VKSAEKLAHIVEKLTIIYEKLPNTMASGKKIEVFIEISIRRNIDA